MAIKIIGVVVLVLVIFLIYVTLQSGEFKIERSVTINAPAATIFPYTNNPRLGEEWNPFSGIDPNNKINFDGPAEGVGAKMNWVGNSQAGEGFFEIVESAPNEKIRARIDFVKPFKGTNYSDYILKSEGTATTMTWVMTGKQAFIPKLVCHFMSLEKLLGEPMTKGLATLKTIAESKK